MAKGTLPAPGSSGVRPYMGLQDWTKKRKNGEVYGAPDFKGPIIYGDPATEKMLNGNGNGKSRKKK